MVHLGKGKWILVAVLALTITNVQARLPHSNVQNELMEYKQWSVLEIALETDDQKNINILQQENQHIRPMGHYGHNVSRIAVSPKKLQEVKEVLNGHGLSFNTLTEDLSRQLLPSLAASREDDLVHGSSTYDRYMTFKEIEDHIIELARHMPNSIKHKVMGKTLENRNIHLVTVSDYTVKGDKTVIFIEGGIHAREWISPAATMNLIDHLVESPALTTNIEWHIMPVTNPDGYVYSHSYDRLWRKNRKGTWFFFCSGVDLNRNFDFSWAGDGASRNPCTGNYAGEKAFSEHESIAVRNAVLEVKDRIQAYVALHSYGQYVMYPWGHTANKKHDNHEELDRVGQSMAKAMLTAEGKRYKVGPASKVLYVAAGASDDWAANITGAPLVYTFELRDEGSHGFLLPEKDIQAGVNEAWVAMQVLAKEVLELTTSRTAILEDDPADLPAEPKKRRRGCKGKNVSDKRRRRCRKKRNKENETNNN